MVCYGISAVVNYASERFTLSEVDIIYQTWQNNLINGVFTKLVTFSEDLFPIFTLFLDDCYTFLQTVSFKSVFFAEIATQIFLKFASTKRRDTSLYF